MILPVDLPTLLAALTAGLLGGLHCAVMCGGIATGFHAMAAGPAHRVAWQANAGRILGYVLAGALVGGLGGGVLRLLRIEALALGLRMAAGLALVLVALRLLDRGGRLDPGPGAGCSRCAGTWFPPTAAGSVWRWARCGQRVKR